jgi:hypothetical protein
MKGNDKRNLLAEGAVIVGSILLAFAIDAAWENRREQFERDQLVTSLMADVEATRSAIQWRVEWSERVVSKAQRILRAMAEEGDPGALQGTLADVGNVFVKGAWAPINHTYEQALGAGSLSLIEDHDMRLMLGRYSERLRGFEVTQRDMTTQYYGQLEPFLVAHTNYAAVAWEVESSGLVRVPFDSGLAELARSRELANLLNLKLELELEALRALRELSALSDAVLQALKGL